MNQPPATRRVDIVDVVHGVAVPDPFRWLEVGVTPEVREWLATHNQRQALDARPDRSRWHERLLALIQLPVSAA